MIHIYTGYPRETAHWHATVADARRCQDQTDWDDAAQKAEIAAEQANERWFEERGGGGYGTTFEEERERYLEGLAQDAAHEAALAVATA